jgi:hypothetical protein
MIGFIELFDTASDYTSQFIITHTYSSVHSHVFTSRCLVAASNSGRSPFSGFPIIPASATSFSHQQLTRTEPQHFSNSPTDWLTESFTNQLISIDWLLITSRQGSRRKHCFPVVVCNCVPWKHACLRSHYSVTAASAGFTVLALSKCHNVYEPLKWYTVLQIRLFFALHFKHTGYSWIIYILKTVMNGLF